MSHCISSLARGRFIYVNRLCIYSTMRYALDDTRTFHLFLSTLLFMNMSLVRPYGSIASIVGVYSLVTKPELPGSGACTQVPASSPSPASSPLQCLSTAAPGFRDAKQNAEKMIPVYTNTFIINSLGYRMLNSHDCFL